MVPGVRGKDIAEKARPVGSEDLTTGALGTWRAHANAWKVYPPFIFDVNGKRIVDGGIETALILEGKRCIIVDLTFDR